MGTCMHAMHIFRVTENKGDVLQFIDINWLLLCLIGVYWSFYSLVHVANSRHWIVWKRTVIFPGNRTNPPLTCETRSGPAKLMEGAKRAAPNASSLTVPITQML